MYLVYMEKDIAQKITISRKFYEELLEEVGITRNPEMMESIEENERAKFSGTKTWELRTK